MRELIAVILLLMIFASSKADEPTRDISTGVPNEAQVYYVNPDGGTRYHTQRDCPSISEKYHSGMVAYEKDALPQGLVECQICKDEAYQQTKATQTALAAGTYIVGVDIPQGLYDFIADENADGELNIYAWDGSVVQAWQVSAGWHADANLSNEQVLEIP